MLSYIKKLNTVETTYIVCKVLWYPALLVVTSPTNQPLSPIPPLALLSSCNFCM